MQRSHIICALLVLFTASATTIARSDTTVAQSGERLLEEVVVTGRRPGPPLWRASNGDNTLWIFGTPPLVPKKLDWDSDSVKHIIKNSQAFIGQPDLNASTSNPFKGLRVLRQFDKAKKLPAGTTLESVLTPQLYARYSSAKERYAPRARSINKLRPLFVAEAIMERALDSVGLSDEDKIPAKIKKLARRADLQLYSSAIELDIDLVVDIFSDINLQAESRCLAAALATIESDLEASIARATAWSEGDAAALRLLDYPDANAQCSTAIEDVPIVAQSRQESRNRWLAHAEMALQSHQSSLTSLPIREIVRPDGLLVQLAKRGYAVRGQ